MGKDLFVKPAKIFNGNDSKNQDFSVIPISYNFHTASFVRIPTR